MYLYLYQRIIEKNGGFFCQTPVFTAGYSVSLFRVRSERWKLTELTNFPFVSVLLTRCLQETFLSLLYIQLLMEGGALPSMKGTMWILTLQNELIWIRHGNVYIRYLYKLWRALLHIITSSFIWFLLSAFNPSRKSTCHSQTWRGKGREGRADRNRRLRIHWHWNSDPLKNIIEGH